MSGNSYDSFKLTPERLGWYKKAGYKIFGSRMHSSAEACRWTKARLNGRRNCYNSVYGIQSHRCVQMTPALDFCTFSCQFCWRSFGPGRFRSEGEWDGPKAIVDGMIKAQKLLLSGFGGNSNTPRKTYEEAINPVHVAISLDSEPALYPHLAGLIGEIKSRKMTAFLVTNGTMPNRLKELLEKEAEPTNLYVSVYATNPEDYKKVTNAFISDAWERVLESLKLMGKFKEARKVFRMTLVKGLNMKDPDGYAKLIKTANPHFVKLKGYSWLGESQKRLQISSMPRMEELEDFAEEINRHIGYIEKARDSVSRVIIMVRDEETWRWSQEKIREQERLLNS